MCEIVIAVIEIKIVGFSKTYVKPMITEYKSKVKMSSSPRLCYQISSWCFYRKSSCETQELFSETCKQMDVELIEFGGEDDHVHLMVCCPPKLAIAHLVSKLKGKSSYFLRKELWPELKKKLWGNHL